METYFVIDCHPGYEAEHYSLRVTEDAHNHRWSAGNLFSPDSMNISFKPPLKVINIETEEEDDEDEDWVYPALTWVPIPLMKRSLVTALRAAGVENLQTYPTRLTNPQGNPPAPEDLYLAVNIVGKVSAADLKASEVSPGNKDEIISVDFDSLAVDAGKAHDMGMFRLAENISAVLVHQRIREAIEAAGIEDLTWFKPEEWAG